MKIGNINNSFAMQSFGGRGSSKINKAKKLAKLAPRISNNRASIVGRSTSQVLSSQFVAQNQMAMRQQSVQQQTMQYPQNMGLQQGYQWQQVLPQMTVQQQSIQQQAMPQQQNGQINPQDVDNVVRPQDGVDASLLSESSIFSSSDFDILQENEKKIRDQKKLYKIKYRKIENNVYKGLI